MSTSLHASDDRNNTYPYSHVAFESLVMAHVVAVQRDALILVGKSCMQICTAYISMHFTPLQTRLWNTFKMIQSVCLKRRHLPLVFEEWLRMLFPPQRRDQYVQMCSLFLLTGSILLDDDAERSIFVFCGVNIDEDMVHDELDIPCCLLYSVANTWVVYRKRLPPLHLQRWCMVSETSCEAAFLNSIIFTDPNQSCGDCYLAAVTAPDTEGTSHSSALQSGKGR